MTPEQSKAMAAVICRAIDYFAATKVGGLVAQQSEEKLALALEKFPEDEKSAGCD